MHNEPRRLGISLGQNAVVSGLLQMPARARAGLVLAHGAGAGMTHPFMTAAAQELAARGIATLRYQFPFMEQGSKRPDPPRVAHAAVRAAVDEASRHFADIPLFAGGKSFGGRMTSQAQAHSPLKNVLGLVFLGFPLHAANQPSADRARHLSDVNIPMLFLQGSRDALAQPGLLSGVIDDLGDRATLRMFTDADHSFHVAARSGQTNDAVRTALFDALAVWIEQTIRC